MTKNNFWQQKKPEDFTKDEWESICTNCGQCCLIKLQDETDNKVYYTNIICRYFDCQNHLCKEYQNRCSLVPQCLKITTQNIDAISWIPTNCAYNILNQTGNLPSWHPLVSGKPLPKEYKVNNVISELDVSDDELEDYIIEEDDCDDQLD